MPATDRIDFEREFEQLVHELRALPAAAPEHVRERVRALGEPVQPATFWNRVPVIPWRRSLLVLAPVCVLGLVTAAVIHGVLNSSPTPEALVRAVPGAAGGTERSTPEDQQVFGAAKPSPSVPFPSLPTPTAGRLQDYEAWMTLRVKDVDALSDQTNEAMRAVRSYGGYVVSFV